MSLSFDTHFAFLFVLCLILSFYSNLWTKKLLHLFPLPVTTTLIHFAISTACAYGLGQLVAFYAQRSQKGKPQAVTQGLVDQQRQPGGFFRRIKDLLPLSICYAVGFLCTNMSFDSVALSFSLTIKSAEPICTAILSWIFLAEVYSLNVYMSLLFIVFGVVLTSFGEMSFVLVGFLSAWMSNVALAGRMVLSKLAQIESSDSSSSSSRFFTSGASQTGSNREIWNLQSKTDHDRASSSLSPSPVSSSLLSNRNRNESGVTLGSAEEPHVVDFFSFDDNDHEADLDQIHGSVNPIALDLPAGYSSGTFYSSNSLSTPSSGVPPVLSSSLGSGSSGSAAEMSASPNSSVQRRILEDTNVLCYSNLIATAFTLPLWFLIDAPLLFPQFLESLQMIGLRGVEETELIIEEGEEILWLLLFSGLAFFLYNLTSIMILSISSPVTHVVAQSMRRVAVICFSVLYFHNPVSTLNVIGIFVLFSSVVWYNILVSYGTSGKRRGGGMDPSPSPSLSPLSLPSGGRMSRAERKIKKLKILSL